MLCANTPVNVSKLIFMRGDFLMKDERNPTKSKEKIELKNKRKAQELKQKINQIKGYTVRVRFLDTGLRLESLIDAYIKEKLFVT